MGARSTRWLRAQADGAGVGSARSSACSRTAALITAVTAVILAALEVAGTAEPVTELGRDPWVQSGRALRAPISVGPGNWRRSAR
jgi:hypothetical protein